MDKKTSQDPEVIKSPLLRSEDLISSRSLTQHFDFTGVLIKWAHSRLRNYLMSAPVGSKGKSKSGSY
jgi:hypothetical protein